MSTFPNTPPVGAVRAPTPTLPSRDQEERHRRRRHPDKPARDSAASLARSEETGGDREAGPHHIDEYA